ncbi:MAG: hypothetical protein ACLR7J_08440 [[Ruminococcus] torques]
MGMNRKTGRGAKFLIVFVVIVIIMAAVTFFAGKVCLSFVKGVHRICVETKYGSGFRKRRTERNDRMDV